MLRDPQIIPLLLVIFINRIYSFVVILVYSIFFHLYGALGSGQESLSRTDRSKLAQQGLSYQVAHSGLTAWTPTPSSLPSQGPRSPSTDLRSSGVRNIKYQSLMCSDLLPPKSGDQGRKNIITSTSSGSPVSGMEKKSEILSMTVDS